MVRLASEYAHAEFSYAEVGATRDGAVPAGYERIDYSWRLGSGADLLERAAQDVLIWFMHSRANTYPISSAEAAEPGSNILLQQRLFGFAVLAPCRVVWTSTDGPERGFAYGTLEGHPEVGEEAFVVAMQEDGEVSFRVSGFSRPAPGLPARLRPITKGLQRRAIRRYHRALTSAL